MIFLYIPVTDIDGWWKGMRDTFTKLTKTKSGDALEDLPYKQNWILTKFAFLRERPITNQYPVKSVRNIKANVHEFIILS